MPLKVGSPLPSFDGVSRWLNGSISNEQLQNRPVLVDFWALSCPFCLRNLPRLHEWQEAYATANLQIVTVHLPMREIDRDIDKVRATLAEFGIEEPCALDHEGILAARFETGGIWPYYFLFDAQGVMRSRAAGYSGLQLLEKALQRSLALSPA